MELYSNVVNDQDTDCLPRAQCYCNRSLVRFKLGDYTHAMEDATKCLDLVNEEKQGETMLQLKSKAYHRQAQALIQLGNVVDALAVYKKSLKECSDESISMPLQAATLLTLEKMPATWLAEYWAGNVARGEAPHPLSTRDGILLKKIPESKRLSTVEMKQRLVELLKNDQYFVSECQTCLVLLWCGKYSMKSCCAFIRGSIYMSSGDDVQGERDATVALVYGPQTRTESRSCWAAAYALRSRCLEARGENVGAVLDILQAIEFCDDDVEDRQQDGVLIEYNNTLNRLLPRIPEHYSQAIQKGCGYAGLQKMMMVERERMQPEYMKNRPKYYYYYEWMKKRIQDRHPSIEEGIMDKLLTLDATELDLLLQYPQAIDTTVKDLEAVLEKEGPEVLESYQVPLLSWDTLQKIKSQESLEAPSTTPAIAAP